MGRLRTILGVMLSATALLGALLVWLPTPWFNLWIAHFVAVELGRQLAFCGLAGALALRDWRFRGLALVASVLCALPAERTRYAVDRLPAAVSRAVGAAPTVTKDVALSPEVSVDLYEPAEPGRHPLVVVVHGGSWHAGEKGEVPHVSAALARHGALVADVHYRLAPDHLFPSPLADVKCALGSLRTRPDVDSTRVFALGRSAGGHLALMAALTVGLPDFAPSCPVPDLPLTGVIAIYPTTDFVFGDANAPSPDPIDNRGAYRDLLGFAPASAPDRAAAASPVKHVERAGPLKVLLIHGEADRLVPVEHTTRLAAALRAAGNVPEVYTLTGADHAFDHHPGSPADVFALGRIAAMVLDP